MLYQLAGTLNNLPLTLCEWHPTWWQTVHDWEVDYHNLMTWKYFSVLQSWQAMTSYSWLYICSFLQRLWDCKISIHHHIFAGAQFLRQESSFIFMSRWRRGAKELKLACIVDFECDLWIYTWIDSDFSSRGFNIWRLVFTKMTGTWARWVMCQVKVLLITDTACQHV